MNDSYCAASSNSSQLHENTGDENPIQVAGRLFGALEYLAYNGTSTLAELTQALGLNKSTTHRVLASLQYMNYVRQDPGTGHYEATFKLAKLAEQLLEQVDVAQMARPYLKELSAKVKETVHFVERDKDKVVYVDKVDCADHSMHMKSYIGSKIPFYRTGVGKAMMANLTDPEIMSLWNSCTIEKRTAYTITDSGDFLEEIADVRRKGYALDNEENETGIRCIAAALAMDGGARYAFSVSVPIGRMDNERIRELSGIVLETKAAIDAELTRRLQGNVSV
jgi:DNA-binding IclR family transcriptional regulator